MSAIKLQSVSKYYGHGRQRVRALDNINLIIKSGEFVAIHGPSGSGKSTLCNLLGLIDQPSHGHVLFSGIDLKLCNDQYLSKLRGKQIGLIFQNFNLIPVLTALENVLLPLQFHGKLLPRMRTQAKDLLCKLGLVDEVHRRPLELSGGQQQRVAIARALITDPTVIIADEPTANLDTNNALAIVDLMHANNRSQGTTFIFSTHDARLLDRVGRKIHLNDGRIVEDTKQGQTSC